MSIIADKQKSIDALAKIKKEIQLKVEWLKVHREDLSSEEVSRLEKQIQAMSKAYIKLKAQI